jgi:NTE family protein
MKIGLALSGGGVRATAFHLGVLKRVAESPHWPGISFLSSVSGGSLCLALVFEKAGQCWPAAQRFTEHCLPEIRTLLTSYDLEGEYKRLLCLRPWLFFRGRASLIAKLIHKRWGITGKISQMPDFPRWEICATCYETGKNWRFSKKRMGDYIANYVVCPDFPLAEAAAASAAVPGAIGPLYLRTSKYRWHKYPEGGNEPDIEVEPVASRLTLWDGGVYENLGVEAMFKPHQGLREEVDFLIVSDASKPLGFETRRLQWRLPPYVPPFRLIDVATDQVRAFRLRTIFSFLDENKNAGVILRMGNTVTSILRAAGKEPPAIWNGRVFLSQADVEAAAGLETTLRKLTSLEYDRLLNHGYEVADVTLYAYDHSSFVILPSECPPSMAGEQRG